MKSHFMISRFTTICSFVFGTIISLNVRAQVPATVWEKGHGGAYTDGFNAVTQTQDGGYIATGIYNIGNYNYWIQKMDADGNAVWSKNYGGSSQDISKTVIQLGDGTYIVGGVAWSNNGDVTGSHGSHDGWILKLNSAGDIIWKKCYGGSSYEDISKILKLSDGSLLVLGATSSDDGDLAGINTVGFWGESNLWLMKLDTAGNIIWQKTYGGLSHDAGYDLIAMPDGGFALAGTEATATGAYDIFVTCIDSLGNEAWKKVFGYSDYDRAYALTVTDKNDILIAGMTLSTDFPGYNGGGSDAIIAKLNGSTGAVIWQKAIGGSGSEWITSITRYKGLYVLAGTSSSADGDISAPLGDWDIWLVAIDDEGNIQWDKNYGGTSTEGGSTYNTSIIPTTDNGLVIAGMTGSDAIHGGGGLWDGYIFKLKDIATGIDGSNLMDFSIYPNPANNYLYIQTNQLKQYNYNLIDVNGRLLRAGSFYNTPAKIDMGTLPAGTYFLQLRDEWQKKTTTIIKQ